MEKDIDNWCNDSIICPYCGYDNGDDDYSTNGHSGTEEQCVECEKRFHCEPEYSVTYSTYKRDCWNGEPHKWETERCFQPYTDGRKIKQCQICYKNEVFKEEV